MSESKAKSNMEKISDIVKAINEYTTDDLGYDLAAIQTRVESVNRFNRIDADEKKAKKDPNYYKIKAVETLHSKASSEYNELYTSSGADYQKKASLFGQLYIMDKQLLVLEGGNDENED